MKTIFRLTIFFFAGLLTASCGKNKSTSETESHPESAMQYIEITTPDEALAEMKAGNQRFLERKFVNTDYKEQIEHTKTSQHPHTLVLSCMDSRVPPEIIFDQGIGKIFVVRVAGEIEDPNILGSIEYATKVKGT